MDLKEKDKERKNLGHAGENIACRLVSGMGWELLTRNFRAGHKELDLVCLHNRDLRFVEVKTRRLPMEGEPWEAVNAKKQKNLCAAAKRFIGSSDFRNLGIALDEVHFDVICIVWSEDGLSYETEFIPDAFYPIFT